jgi:hypothetical protein
MILSAALAREFFCSGYTGPTCCVAKNVVVLAIYEEVYAVVLAEHELIKCWGSSST